MLNELEVLKTVITRLDSAGIPYMVSGSIAANFYTTPRMTRDIDIVIEVGEEDIEKLFSLFSDDFYIDRDLVKEAIRDKQMFNIIHNEAIIKIDFIVRKETEYRKIEFERRRSLTFEGLRIFITSPEDLIISKLYWAKDSLSEMQMRDTSPQIESRFIEMMMKKSGEERMRLGFSMFEMARRQVIASIKMDEPNADIREIRKGIFLRFYGLEFSPEEQRIIIERIQR